MEYMKKRSTSVSDEEDEEVKAYTVVAAAPPSRDNLNLGDTMALTVIFDSKVDERSLAANIPDASKICRLQSMVQDNTYINPVRHYFK